MKNTYLTKETNRYLSKSMITFLSSKMATNSSMSMELDHYCSCLFLSSNDINGSLSCSTWIPFMVFISDENFLYLMCIITYSHWTNSRFFKLNVISRNSFYSFYCFCPLYQSNKQLFKKFLQTNIVYQFKDVYAIQIRLLKKSFPVGNSSWFLTNFLIPNYSFVLPQSLIMSSDSKLRQNESKTL